MKWLLVILIAFLGLSFNGNYSNEGKLLNKDTVPTGAAPQLFGSKVYEFKNYTLIDSFLMVMGGDTFAIPRWPALKYKNSDNRWYGYHGTRWRAFLNGTDTISLSNRINAAVTPPGTPLNAIQYNNAGSFAGDSLQYYPTLKKTLTSQDYQQFGRPITGFFQDSAWNYAHGYIHMIYPRGSNGGPGQAVDPSWGADTIQPFYTQVSNARYDVTQPENAVVDIIKFGNTGSYRPMARMALEQNFYNHIEWHWATKPRLMNPNDEIRHWSWFISDINGTSNLTTRSSDNRWGWPIVNSPHYDKEYAVLDAQKFELKAISSPAYIYARAGHLQQWHIGMLVDTSTQEAHLDAAGVASLSLGSISHNELVIGNPGTTSGLITANKSLVVAGKQLQVGGLANGALGFSVTSGALGYIWQTNADANGYGQTYTNGKIELNRDPLGFSNSDKMLTIYNNYNPNDSIYHIRGNGDIYTKGMITANADSTANATGGIVYRDAGSGNFRLTNINAVSGISGLTPGRVVIPATSTTITDDPGLLYNTTMRELTTDSTSVIQHRANYLTLNPVLQVDSVDGFGNSIMNREVTTNPDSSFLNHTADYFNAPPKEHAVSGSGIYYATALQLKTMLPLHNGVTMFMSGFNSIRNNTILNGLSGRKTQNSIIEGYKSAFANHFLKSFIGIADGAVVKTGAWSTAWDATVVGGKSTQGLFTFSTGAYYEYVFTDSTVVVGLIGQNDLNQAGSTYNIYIDGNLVYSGSTSNKADGVEDGFGDGGNHIAVAQIITGLTYGNHTIKVENSGSGVFICDYVGHLRSVSTAPPIVMYNIPYMKGVGYAIAPAHSNPARTDTVNLRLDSLYDALPDSYKTKAFMIKTNNYYDTTTGTYSDDVHPNDIGHRQIFEGTIAGLNTTNYPEGSLFYAAGYPYFNDGTGVHKLILGEGTANYIPRFTNANKITSGIIQDDGTNVGVGQTPATYKLSVAGTLRNTTDAYFATSSGNVGIGTTVPDQKLDVNGHTVTRGSFFSKGNLAGVAWESRVTGGDGYGWSFYSIDTFSTNLFSGHYVKDRIKFWNPGGMTIANFDEPSPVYAGRRLDVHGSVAIEKDSIPTLSSISSQYVLVVDTAATASDSNVVKRISVANLIPGTSYTFSNGLTESGGAVKLGGALTENTTIDGSSAYTTTFTGSRTTTNSTLIAANTSSGRALTGSSSTGIGIYGSGSVGVLGNSASGTGVWAESTNGQAFYALSPYTNGVGVFVANPTSTNTTHTVLNLTRTSTSAGSNNIAGALDFHINNTTAAGSVTLANRLISKLTTATSTAEVSQFEIWGVNSGVMAKKFSIAGSGQFTADGYGAGTFTGTPTGTAQFTSSGNVIEGPIVAAGTYTPTLTNGTNVNSSTASSCQYMRVGNTVTVSGKVNITPTSTGATALGISLPIASSIANDNECGGTGTVGNTTDLFSSIRGDATNDRAELFFTIGVTGTTSAQDWYFSFTYRIL
jgi:hypothetical protein